MFIIVMERQNPSESSKQRNPVRCSNHLLKKFLSVANLPPLPSKQVIQINLHSQSVAAVTTNRLVLGEKEQWLQLSKKSEHLDKIPEIKKAVGILNKNGSFEEIMNKYYGHDWKDLNQ